MPSSCAARVALATIILVALAVPTASALLDPDKIVTGLEDQLEDQQNQQGGGGGNGIDPSKIAQDLQRSVGEGGYVPNRGGVDRGGDGFGSIGPRVAETLRENMLITGAAAGVLIVATFAGWFLASRYVDPKVALRSPERSMLYGFVKGNPGVHLKQLSTEFRMKTSTVLWHVRKLEAAQLIRSKKANGYRVFYPVSGGMEASRVSEAVTALSNPNARGIFAFLVGNPGATLRTLVERLGINPGTVRWHLKKLHKAGLLEETPAEGTLRPTGLGQRAWIQIQSTPQSIQVPVVSAAPETVTAQATDELKAES